MTKPRWKESVVYIKDKVKNQKGKWVGPYGPACSKPGYKCSNCGEYVDGGPDMPDVCIGCGSHNE